MSIYTESDINFVIDCPTDAKGDDCDWDDYRIQRLTRIANTPIIIRQPTKTQNSPKEYCSNLEFLILFLMFAATLCCIMFG